MRDLIKTWLLFLAVLVLGLAMPKCSPAQEVRSAGVPPVIVGLDAGPVWSKQSLQFRDDQFQLSGSRTLLEVSAWCVVPDLFKFNYALTTGFQSQDDLVPSGIVRLADVEFGKEAKQGQTNKPLSLEWRQGPSNRFELVGLRGLSGVYPAVVAQWSESWINGCGEDKDGKQREASERFTAFVIGPGVEMVWNGASALFAGSKDYTFLRLAYAHPVTDWARVGLGYQRYEIRKDVRLIFDQKFINVEVVF